MENSNFEFFESFQKLFEGADDFIVREISISNTCAKVVFIDNLVDSIIMQSGLLDPLSKVNFLPAENKSDFLIREILSTNNPTKKNSFKDLEHDVLSGNCLLFISGEQNAISMAAQGFEKRAIAEPPTSAVIKGPREGFIEDLNTNISLLRRRLKTHNFAIEKLQVGQRSKTDICIAYIKGVADQNVIREVRRRLEAIDIDAVLDSFYLQDMLQEKMNSIFKQVGSSEKPDIVTSKILEGRVAVLCNGSPIVLTVPFLLIEDLHSADDYYNHAARATFMRLIRVFGMLMGVLLPGIYVATQIFHYRLLPINFLINLLVAVQGLTFPPLIEILFVLFLFEILNEASVRMPKHLGMALSVIGALVLGETAVQAGLISSPAIVVVAISGITIYTVPDQVGTLSLIRFLFTIIGGIAGYFGLLVGTVFLFTYLSGMQSYGTPYLAPYAPNIKSDKKDGFIKKDLRYMKQRPKSIPHQDKIRLKNTDSTEEGIGQ